METTVLTFVVDAEQSVLESYVDGVRQEDFAVAVVGILGEEKLHFVSPLRSVKAALDLANYLLGVSDAAYRASVSAAAIEGHKIGLEHTHSGAGSEQVVGASG